ncbi:dihydrodipicolinate reductase [Nocardia abscessus]|uniref:NAD(P)H-dependent amine dehydrogenase family protein n=1 Tax=Nocardia abscessus TaxID=120957 RepID=UPI002457146D|nr:dihydrodipicolinate reductase [Nocardia abscessus]
MDTNPLLHETIELMARQYRVVQWATGNVGRPALRALIEHPNLTLVGVHTHTPDKVGTDAGLLCRLPARTGITATGDIDKILELGADCVVYTPRVFDLDTVCRLLATGTNVVTTHDMFHHPAGMDRALCARVEAACSSGGASIHSTGSSPGFLTETMPIVLSSTQRRLDRMAINEFVDLTPSETPWTLLGMGFGTSRRTFEPHRLNHAHRAIGPSLRLAAEVLGLPLDAVDVRGELATASRDVQVGTGVFRKGTVVAQRITVSGIRGGRTLLQFRSTRYCSTDIGSDWSLRPTGWRISVEGDAPLELDLRPMETSVQANTAAPTYAANRAVNTIPYLCAAPPGIRTALDMPPIRFR